MEKYIILTIDVEDWFQVENFKPYIPFSSWPCHSLRVEKNTHDILDLLDSVKTNSVKPRATFFILGWLAERLPNLVREIGLRGHEVASHGYFHKLCSKESRENLIKDLKDSKKCLEDIIGEPVRGYRAPSFSITEDILKIIEDCGYDYDSSYNSFEMHGRYGHVDMSGKEKKGSAIRISESFYEIPLSNLKTGKHILPWSGGGYFRLIPFIIFKQGVEAILNKENAYIFYMHPWEIDPDQPRVTQASFNFKFRHYINLNRSKAKLTAMLEHFGKCNFISCKEYLYLNNRLQ